MQSLWKLIQQLMLQLLFPSSVSMVSLLKLVCIFIIKIQNIFLFLCVFTYKALEYGFTEEELPSLRKEIPERQAQTSRLKNQTC